MKKKKLQLKTLKVKSFVTTMNADEVDAVKGGLAYRTHINNIEGAQGIAGKRPVWTVTEQRRGYIVPPTPVGGKKS